MKVSVLIGTRNRVDPLIRCLESVLKQDYPKFEVLVLDDGSDKFNVCEAISKLGDPRLRCVRNPEPMGVAGGRNRLMSLASGDIFCIIDDDAYFADEHALSSIVRVFAENPQIGIVATKVVDYRTTPPKLLVPFPRRAIRKQPTLVNTEQDVSYFVGTCHAIRRNLIESCGLYQENLVYGEEELDLSYRAVQAGFRIRYAPSVVVYHRPEASVVRRRVFMREPELYHHVKNRFILAWKYLPLKFIFPYICFWITYYGLRSIQKLAILESVLGITSGIAAALRTQRTPLTKSAVTYMRTHYGRLWY